MVGESWGPEGVVVVLSALTASALAIISALYSRMTHHAVNGHYASLEKRMDGVERRLSDEIRANAALRDLNADLQERLLSAEKRAKPEN